MRKGWKKKKEGGKEKRRKSRENSHLEVVGDTTAYALQALQSRMEGKEKNGEKKEKRKREGESSSSGQKVPLAGTIKKKEKGESDD